MSYSPPVYPAAIPDQITDLPDRTDDIDWIEAWIYNYVKKELVAVMTELGTDPAGTEATVAARLTAIEAAGVDESVILNIYLNSFRIAILGSYAVMNMVKGISDEYEDETGIDTTASTNEDYDSANDLYSPDIPAYASQYPTQDGDHVKATTYLNVSYYPYFATDPLKSLTGAYTDNAWIASTYGNQRFHMDLGSAKIITRIYYENNHSSGGSTERGVKAFTFWGSNTGVGSFDDLVYANDEGWTQITASQAEFDIHTSVDESDPKYITVTNSTAYRYYAFKFSDNQGGSEAQYMGLRRIELQTGGTVADMTLVSEKFTADVAPDDARIIIFEEDVDAITLNTDIKAYVSRDDGANYTQITLTDEGDYSGSKRILSGTADISGQPSGTDMVYKITTHNNKDLKLHGVGLAWV